MEGPKGSGKVGGGYKADIRQSPEIKFKKPPERELPDIGDVHALKKKIHGGQKTGVLKSPKLPPKLPAAKELRTGGQAYKILVLPQGNQPLAIEAIKAGWSYAGSAQGRIFYSQPGDRSKVSQAINGGNSVIVGSDE